MQSDLIDQNWNGAGAKDAGGDPMVAIPSNLLFYPVAERSGEKWTVAARAWFLIAASGLSWAGFIALIWRFL